MVMSGATNYSRFVLLDANIVAGYYLPESLQSVNAKKRVNNIIEAVLPCSQNIISRGGTRQCRKGCPEGSPKISMREY